MARKLKYEVSDRKWTTYFLDFFTLLDDETRSKYRISGLNMLQNGCEGRPTVKVDDISYGLLAESTVYRAMAAICEAEGDYYLALACLMCVKSCIHNYTDTPSRKEWQWITAATRWIDKQIDDMKKKLPDSRRDILKELKKYVR